MNVVDPVDVGPRTVSTVNHDPEPLPREPAGPLPAGSTEERLAENMTAKRAGHTVHDYIWLSSQVVPRPVSDKVDRATEGQEPRQGQVCPVHPAQWGEVAGYQHPSGHPEDSGGGPGLGVQGDSQGDRPQLLWQRVFHLPFPLAGEDWGGGYPEPMPLTGPEGVPGPPTPALGRKGEGGRKSPLPLRGPRGEC